MCNFCSITRCYHITTTETTEDELVTPTTVTTTTSVTTPTTVTVTTTPMSTSTLLDSTSLKLEIRTTSKVPHLGNSQICRIRHNVCSLSVVLVLIVGYVFHLFLHLVITCTRLLHSFGTAEFTIDKNTNTFRKFRTSAQHFYFDFMFLFLFTQIFIF